jgi:putative peptidoglycan lipid II flippase
MGRSDGQVSRVISKDPELGMAASVLRRLTRIHANHKAIASSALLIGVLTVFAKLFVAGREVAIAWRYGVSGTVDAYQLALTIVTWVPMLLSGAMAVVLVPRFVSLNRRPQARERFVRELNGTILLLAMVVGLGSFLLAPLAARMLTSTSQAKTLHLTSVLAQQMAPVAVAVTIAGYFTARLQSRERFAYTIAEALPALVIVLFVIVPLAISDSLRLAMGTAAGYGAMLLFVGFLVIRGDPPVGMIRFRHASAEWHSLYGSTLLMALGQMLITAANPIDQAFASRLAEGAVATLGYASRIIALLAGLATVVIGRALLPILSRAVADGETRLGRRQALQWCVLMFCAAVAVSGFVWILAPWMVQLLYQRGAFDAAATAQVAAAMRYGVVQLPFYFGGVVLVQWYAANERFRDLLLITSVALAVKVASNAILAPVLGVGGIMLATAVMYALTCSLMLLMLGPVHSHRVPLR